MTTKAKHLEIAVNLGMLAAAAGLMMTAARAQAAMTPHVLDGNAVTYCQAFTPGPTNTIRNRVLGMENIGAATVNVACDWPSYRGDSGSTYPDELDVMFSNNNASTDPSGAMTITCTMLTGYQNEGGSQQWATTRTFQLPVGATPGSSTGVTLTGADNPAGATADLGSPLIGINCALPHAGVINDSYLFWHADDGV